MVGTLPLMKLSLWSSLEKTKQICHNYFLSLLAITNSKSKVKEGTYDGVDHKLLECPHQQKDYSLDQKRTCKHLVDFCSY
jgi:hypothetical protein